MFERNWARRGLILLAGCFLLFQVLEVEAWARAGGGRSSGSRGSRPSTPASPAKPSSPSQPSQQQRQYAPTPPPSQPTGSPFLRGLAGGLVGGLIGGMLFRSMASAGPGTAGGWSGPGLFDILLIGAILYAIYWFVVKRRRAAAAAGTSYYQDASAQTVESGYAPPYGSPQSVAYEEVDEVSRGLSHIQRMDPSFDEAGFRDQAMDIFFDVQGAWAQRDMNGARNSLTEEMFRVLQADADQLRAERRINRLENIAVRSVDLVEVWQESGQDFITTKLYANLLDYTVDEGSGKVVSGSKEDPVKFEEYWTFCRPVGNYPWRLSAISQARS